MSDRDSDEAELLSIHSDSDYEGPQVPKRPRLSESKKQKKDDKEEKQLSSVSDEEESDSGEERERRPTPGSASYAGPNGLKPMRIGVGAEIVVSDDEDEDDDDSGNEEEEGTGAGGNGGRTTTYSVPSEEDAEDSGPSNSGYGLRRKRKVNYMEIENGADTGDLEDTTLLHKKKEFKKQVLEIFNLSTSKISRLIKKPELADNFTKCKIVFLDGTDSSRLQLVSKLFEKCGHQFEELFVLIRNDEESRSFLANILKKAPSLGKFDYRYHNRDDAHSIITILNDLMASNHLLALNSIKIVSISGDESLNAPHLTLLSRMPSQIRSLELGDALWEDVTANIIETILKNQKASLETLIIHGGFKGNTQKERILITFPKMEVLTTLSICPSYTFLSEIKNPYSKKVRMITLDVNREESYKIAIKFSQDIPTLSKVILGNLIDIEDLNFSTVRRLSEFKCGSYWNLSIRFPAAGSRKALVESTVSEFQFPDALKDPTFPVKVAKHFPYLRKVFMYLPSVPVLRAFFKSFENSLLEELYLKTQFDFESTMESCLLPRTVDALHKSDATISLLNTLKVYKHFDEYVKYYNIELPVEEDDLMEGHSAGIKALKNLKILHLEHIPRKLLIPNEDEERKWYDHNCKFMSTTFGYERYPLNFKCHREILQLNLSEYIWKNMQIKSDFTAEFYEAGFVDVSDVQVYSSDRTQPEEEDLFVPIRKNERSATGTQVKIMPSMLFPDIKAKPEPM